MPPRVPSAIALVVCLLSVVRLSPFAFASRVELPQGHFEVAGEGAVVRYSEWPNRDLYPVTPPIVGAELRIPPGATLVLPLEADSVFEVRSTDPDRAPLALLGFETTSPRDESGAGRPSENELGDAQSVALSAGQFALRKWNGQSSWVDEGAALRQLAETCAGKTLRVELSGGRPRLTLGHCVAESRDDTTRTSWKLAVVGGPDWALVTRNHGAWPGSAQIRWAVVVGVLLLQAMQVASFGLPAAGVVAAFVFAVGLANSPLATAMWLGANLLAAVVGLVLLIVFLSRRIANMRSPLIGVGLSLAGLAGAVLLVLGLIKDGVDVHQLEPAAQASGPELLLVGYSTARDVGLKDPNQGTRAQLDRQCTAWVGRVGRWASPGGTFAWTKQALCSDHIPVGAHVAFLGGANDDLFYTGSRWTLLFRFVAFMRFEDLPLVPERWDAMLDQVAAQVVTQSDRQMADIESGLACLARRDARFSMFHDFLVEDLRGSRSPARAGLMERRRKIVRAAGGDFVDLHEEIGARAGVAWFNDFIHLSSIGHRHAAAVICSTTTPR